MNIMSFVLILLLTVLPICAGVYLFARTDAHENELLRTKVGAMKVYEEEEDDIDRMEADIISTVTALDENINKVTIAKDMTGELGDQIAGYPTSLKEKLVELNGKVIGQEKKKDIGIMLEMCKALKSYNDNIYTILYDEKEDMRKNSERIQLDLDRIKNVARQHGAAESELITAQ